FVPLFLLVYHFFTNIATGTNFGGHSICVNHFGKDYSLCPMFPCHEWETLDSGLMDILLKYHDLQMKYSEKK
ncbi:MAG: hypothetical protein CVU97_07180, partial [Firmicutes bacterium HGW-Firmicutes-21]